MSRCPACGDKASVPIAPYRYQSPVFDGCHMASCQSCSLVFVRPMPDALELERYNSRYFAEAHGGHPASRSDTAFFQALAKVRSFYIIEYLKNNGIIVESVLEFGPGQGHFARAWMESNPSCRYRAVETDVSCHTLLRQIGVELVGDTSNFHADLIVMSHVLEHVPDPQFFLNHAAENLADGGVLFIEVPCSDWMYKSLDEPHILFFNKRSMRSLLESVGFEKIELAYVGESIQKLKKKLIGARISDAIRSRLIKRGILWPLEFTRAENVEGLSKIERAAIAPFQANVESNEEARWLRVIARTKRRN